MKYEQIYNEVKQKITSGVLPPGTQLPSLRAAAKKWHCDKLTVKKAYEQLEQESVITMEIGRGSFVSFPENVHNAQPSSSGYNFYSAYISEVFFPLAEVQNILCDLAQEEQNRLFAAAPVGGDPELREALGRRYRVSPDRMVIISGAQQGLGLAGNLFQANIREAFLFEDPTYSGALSLFKPKHFVPMSSTDNDGPDIDKLEYIVKKEKIEVFYTIAGIHNPTGITVSRKKRQQIAGLAEKYNFYILEDDYLSEFLPENIEQKRFIDVIPERTIYIKSLSKITAPGVRIGFLACPEPLYESMMFHKFNTDIGTPLLLQKFLLYLIKNKLLDKHIKKCASVIESRKKSVLALLKDYHFLSAPGKQYGYNMWIKSEQDISISDFPGARGENFSFSPDYRRFFRLSLMTMEEDVFKQGCMYLRFLFSALDRGNETTMVL